MTQKTLVVLVVLNLALLVGLVLTGGPQPAARAQFGGGPSFMMIAAQNSVNNRDIIYVMETNSGELRAIQYSSADGRLLAVGQRSVGRDARRGGGGSR